MSVRSLPRSGHVAVLTGGNQGICAAIAKKLASNGAAVLVTFLRLEDEPVEGVPKGLPSCALEGRR